MTSSEIVLFDKVSCHSFFKTDRFYDHQQEIKAYQIGTNWLDEPVIYFTDESRKLDGVLAVSSLSSHDIMKAYDSTDREFHPNFEIKEMVRNYEANL